jgi:hypothetical protein
MRRRYIQQPDGSLLEVTPDYQSQPRAGFFIAGDIGPYKSMITGETIEGRRQHREHLKAHNCVEVGNSFDKPQEKPVYQPGALKQTLIDVFNSRT